MVAPCGLNCVLCRLTFKTRGPRSACRGNGVKPRYCSNCRIRSCDQIATESGRFCFECPEYPYRRLVKLDARYRARSAMSSIENLELIRHLGLDQFTEAEKQRWACPGSGALLSVHKKNCVSCGRSKAEMARH
jgi:hypothetical protein